MKRLDPFVATAILLIIASCVVLSLILDHYDVGQHHTAPQTVTTRSPACSTRDTQAALLIPMLTRYDRLQEQALTAALTGHRRRALDLAAHTGPVTTTRWVEAKEACDE